MLFRSLKDQGQIEQSIQLYTEAINRKPDFDIALANLANAIKDAVCLFLVIKMRIRIDQFVRDVHGMPSHITNVRLKSILTFRRLRAGWSIHCAPYATGAVAVDLRMRLEWMRRDMLSPLEVFTQDG